MAAGKNGGLIRGKPALALQRLEQGGLLAADVGTGARVDDHVHRESRAEDVPTDGAVGVGVVEGGLHPLEAEGELAPDEDEHLGDLQRVGGYHHAFDELMGITLHQQVVLEGGRLRLVAVDHQVGDRALPQHRPLAAGREPGAAPSEQAGRVDLGGHLLGCLGQRHAQALVATGGQVALEGVRVVMAHPGGHDLRRIGDGHQRPSPAGGRFVAGRPGVGGHPSLLGHCRGVGLETGRCAAPGSGCRATGSRRHVHRTAARRPAGRTTPASGHRRSGGSPGRTVPGRSRPGTRPPPR